MHRLPQRVHPCIGAAGTRDFNGRTGGPGEAFFHHLLHRQPVFLPLPAGIGRAVIGKGQADALHSTFLSITIRPIKAAIIKPAITSPRVNFKILNRVR